MSYEDTVRAVVADSIRSVAMVDDEYADLCDYYDADNDCFKQIEYPINAAESARIYRSFKDAGIACRIVTYRDGDVLARPEQSLKEVGQHFEGTDLLVLDWKLERDPAEHGRFALRLIQEIAAKQTLSWVYVYTTQAAEQTDRKEIAERIYASLLPSRLPDLSSIPDEAGTLEMISKHCESTEARFHLETLERLKDHDLRLRLPNLADRLGIDLKELEEAGCALLQHLGGETDWRDAIRALICEKALDRRAGVTRPVRGLQRCELSLVETRDVDGEASWDVTFGGLTIMIRRKGATGPTEPSHLAEGVTKCVSEKSRSIVSALSLILDSSLRRALPSVRSQFTEGHDRAAIVQLHLQPEDEPDPTHILLARALDQVAETVRNWHEAGGLVPVRIWCDYMQDRLPRMQYLSDFTAEGTDSVDLLRGLHDEGLEAFQAFVQQSGRKELSSQLPKCPTDFWEDRNNLRVVRKWARQLCKSLMDCAVGTPFAIDTMAFRDERLHRDLVPVWRRAIFLWLVAKDGEEADSLLRHAAELNNYICTVQPVGLGEPSYPTRLGFGHILEKSGANEYYLCVTAACDCVRPGAGRLPQAPHPGGKNDAYYYSFIKGEKTSLSQAFRCLTDERYSYSFVRLETGKVIAVRWVRSIMGMPAESEYQPRLEGPGRILQVLMPAVPEPEELLYLQQMRPLFAQQIANRAAAHLARVGVDWIQA